MNISFDPEKRAWTLAERGLDFADAGAVFAGPRLTQEDDRFAYSDPLPDLWLARRAAGAGGVDAEGNRHSCDLDEVLP